VAWINSDDVYLPNAFKTVASIFKNVSSVNGTGGTQQQLTPMG
jgi:hypothetical protein